jgi:glycosyltransferase involved in cell wall biosynthesis
MRSVMVTKFVPSPPNSGGKQRSLAILERLAARGPTVLCAFDDGTANPAALGELGVEVRSVAWRPALKSSLTGALLTRSATAGRFWSAQLHSEVVAATQSGPTDLLQIEYGQLTPYARDAEASLRVLDLHNVESALVERMAAIRRQPLRQALELEARRLRALERSALRSFDAVAVVSEAERERIGATDASVLVCPNGYEATEPAPLGDEPAVAFVGMLGWGPNADAAVWLAHAIWPRVLGRIPDAKLLLVGRDPAKAVRALAGESIEVTGAVDEVGPFLDRARVATAPLRAGGGTRLKILEALGRGRPVVATTIGAEGLEDLVGRGIVVADSAAGVADAVADLLADPQRAEALGRAGHEVVRERYGWDATLQPLFDYVDERTGG